MLGIETAHSPNAHDLNTAYWVTLAVAGALALALNGALIACLVRFRAARGSRPRRFRGHPRTQASVAGAFAVIAVALFVFGVVYTDRAKQVAHSGPAGLAGPLKIRAVGQQWIWRYEYPSPGGGSSSGGASAGGSTGTAAIGLQNFSTVFSYYELVVPVDTAVELTVASTDVAHRWWVPQLGGKVDALPGHMGHTWFRADQQGVYSGQSAGFSGASYAVMRTQVRVVSPEEYQAWLTRQAADIKSAQAYVQQRIAAAGPTGVAEAGAK